MSAREDADGRLPVDGASPPDEERLAPLVDDPAAAADQGADQEADVRASELAPEPSAGTDPADDVAGALPPGEIPPGEVLDAPAGDVLDGGGPDEPVPDQAEAEVTGSEHAQPDAETDAEQRASATPVAEPVTAAPEAPTAPGGPEPSSPVAVPSAAPSTPWRRLIAACRPHMSRAQILAAVLCAVLGFALVVQLRQTKQDEFANLRQSDLVRILDDVTRRSEDLDRERSSLLKAEFDLRSGTDSQRAALELAEKDATTQGILSGRLPAEGPGIEITIVEGDTKVSASRMFNVLEELRNAGAEVIEVNGVRMVTSSHFVDADRGILIDGIVASAPYRWVAIGNPLTLQPAMEIPGGALPTIRADGGRTTIEQHDLVEVKAVREPAEPEFAVPGTLTD